jgi:methionine synthase / methylenetetrahydrofolate reductase(NADPH)
MDRKGFRQWLDQAPRLLDGAMGTVLHGRGVPIDRCFDAINREDPALVADIHRGYIDAGADIIETNSFGANRFKLAHHGLEDEVVALNQAAVAVARRVIEGSFKSLLLAGSVGPLGVRLAPLGRVKAADAQAAFADQIAALIAAPAGMERGVDLIILETIADIKEMKVAIQATRSVSPDIPLVAMMTFTRDDRTVLGDSPAEVARQLAALDVDAIGVNCSSGPVQVLRLLATLHELAPDMPLVAAPNAGWPQQMEGGRVLYPATPDYFGHYASGFARSGARLIGGCCGTTDRHVAAMRKALDELPVIPADLPAAARSREAPTGEAVQIPADRPTRLSRALTEGRFVLTVEMSPPRGIAAQQLLAGARMLKEAGATFIDVADNPLARMRMSAWAAAYLLQQRVGLEAILHFPTRGRSLLRVQGDLLAAHALGIRNLFVVMGDPTRIGDFPEAMDDYDIVPTGLIRLIKQRFNRGVDQSGQAIDQPTSFTVGCALNLTPDNLERELRLFRKKITNGADFALTQPVFDPARAVAFLEAYRQRYGQSPIPIVAGLQPLYNSGNAEFLHNEVPGIHIPLELRERLHRTTNPQAEGVQIAHETLLALRPFVQGAYLIPVFGRYDLVADVLDMINMLKMIN